MKKITLLFIFVFSILKADYLITNGEIALFYDGKNNILKDLHVKQSKNDILSNLQILLIKDYKIYRARNYYTETKFIDGTNIFYLKSNINGEILETYVIPSNNDRDTLYIYTNLEKIRWKNPYKLVYKFSPLILEGNIENKDEYYKYDMINISKDKDSQILVATENDFENFKVKVLENTLLKGLNERLYLVKNISQEKKNDFLKIVFNKKSPTLKKYSFLEIFSMEKTFWKNFNKKYYFLKENVVDQIKKLYLLSIGNYAQSILNMNMSRVKYMEQLKVIYLNGILNKEELIPEFNFYRDDSVQNIYTYYFYIQLCELKNKKINQDQIIIGNLSNLKVEMKKYYTSILNKEGNWLENSVIFYDLLSKLEELQLNKIYIDDIELLKKELSLSIGHSILNSSGIIKNYEYIEYLKILPENVRNKNIEYLLRNTKNRFGLLQEKGIINKIANLRLALLLYENNNIVESDKIFYNIDYFINSDKNYTGTELEETYLYLRNIQYRGLI
ncbi:hypothetical protein NON08_03070 [Cetobacterium somerae]|uniref:hypothetical protein n=1 Tax=Cetobacterium sp. NK01 TaxID=2993530 RepID=UPI00211664AF|nr:hypothetical protein [Cetobacterium sp. NK01]MCQ8211551.1 hypothetical protein [Cetobacterium sp. NK01]